MAFVVDDDCFHRDVAAAVGLVAALAAVLVVLAAELAAGLALAVELAVVLDDDVAELAVDRYEHFVLDIVLGRIERNYLLSAASEVMVPAFDLVLNASAFAVMFAASVDIVREMEIARKQSFYVVIVRDTSRLGAGQAFGMDDNQVVGRIHDFACKFQDSSHIDCLCRKDYWACFRHHHLLGLENSGVA